LQTDRRNGYKTGYKSQNGGVTWRCKNRLQITKWRRHMALQKPVTNHKMAASHGVAVRTDRRNGYKTGYKSQNGGVTWRCKNRLQITKWRRHMALQYVQTDA
jgi:hypothetical protein